mmetsp:Transcript_53732/g.138415  ORF Transcript_53732/g.138415 Transcript_53732/m.138415 type:complete len:289 (-) Transcript_53732:260-1126(-)
MALSAASGRALSNLRSSSALSFCTPSSRPPLLCASARSIRCAVGTSAAKCTESSTFFRFCRVPPGISASPMAASSGACGSIGAFEAHTRAPSLALPASGVSISRRWPRKPKPVTSVTPLTASPSCWAHSAAALFSVDMDVSIAFCASGEAAPRFSAVLKMPVPSGFVSTNTSPSRIALFFLIFFGWTMPMTARPYFGSVSSTEWPPRIWIPASWHLLWPPRRISSRTDIGSRCEGKPTMFSAKSGVAPIAYTSESALAAAILPNVSGSSTTGVKKSVVATMAQSSLIW